jgi:hypothetical protein
MIRQRLSSLICEFGEVRIRDFDHSQVNRFGVARPVSHEMQHPDAVDAFSDCTPRGSGRSDAHRSAVGFSGSRNQLAECPAGEYVAFGCQVVGEQLVAAHREGIKSLAVGRDVPVDWIG